MLDSCTAACTTAADSNSSTSRVRRFLPHACVSDHTCVCARGACARGECAQVRKLGQSFGSPATAAAAGWLFGLDPRTQSPRGHRRPSLVLNSLWFLLLEASFDLEDVFYFTSSASFPIRGMGPHSWYHISSAVLTGRTCLSGPGSMFQALGKRDTFLATRGLR